MLTNRSLRKRFLAYVTAGGLCLVVAGNTLGADCSCGASCDVCPTASPGYGNDCSCGTRKHSCLYKALDAFAGGLERLFCLDRCCRGCDESVCDDGCDAAMIEELMLPMPPSELHYGPLDVHSTPTEHAIELLDSGQDFRSDGFAEAEAAGPPVQVREPDMKIQRQTIPQSQPQSEPGSLFETLSDPFRDDQTRSRAYQPVRPSSYDDDNVELRPIRKRPLSRSYYESSRRVKSVR